MSYETFDRDGFHFEATAHYEPPEPGNSMQAGYEVEIGDIVITDSKEMIDAYGLAEALIMMCDMEAWIIDNESDAIIGEC
jgi:hypothetical protein|tara:strand:+ start:48 stop:287 length:240 start_codon:yes stop_codon:yes gene_type:complete